MSHYNKRAEQLIEQISSGKASEAEINNFLSEVRSEMKTNPSLGKELGPLIPRINKAVNSRAEIPQFDWVNIRNGWMAVGHKPGGKISFEGMSNAGVTAVLTLLQENEGAQQIGQALQRVGIAWLWLPFSAVRPQERKAVETLFSRMRTMLEQGAKIYVHCSAGIHRTGMVTYAFLRYLGQDPKEAMSTLSRMRQLTAEGATPERLSWGDQFDGTT